MLDKDWTTLSAEEICAGVPASKDVRNQIRSLCIERIASESLVPPLSLDLLKRHAAAVLQQAELSDVYLPFVIVVFNNELWWPTVRNIPFEKRLLLIPQCLKHSQSCLAEVDHLGLICKHCGRCVIDQLTRRAEALGYAVLVAEGSPVVMAMIESGQVQATIGVSCLSVLERVFPYMEAGAVPGVAIPLLKDGCADTVFDLDWLQEILGVYADDSTGPVDLPRFKQVVKDWFEVDQLKQYFIDADSDAGQLALDWMARAGKRNRPMLTAGVYATLTGVDVHQIDNNVRQTAVSVECFHKASLIHDDIEDDDDERYDKETLHKTHGVPIALNAGDYLIGQGYRLLAELDCDAAKKVKLLRIASEGHRLLCVGQGEELKLLAQSSSCSVEKVIDIFAQKTSPAFAVALKVGAVLGDADQIVLEALEHYSNALGIAYQIRDDLHDCKAGGQEGCLSIIQTIMDTQGVSEEEAIQRAAGILEDYRKQAIDSLDVIKQADCKSFLRKVITRIFDSSEPMGCCDEYSSESD